MSGTLRLQREVNNRLLNLLPESEYERLSPHLVPVSLPTGKIIAEAFHPLTDLYFITEGVASLVATTTQDESIEIGTISNDGVVGTPLLFNGLHLPYRVIAPIPVKALRLPIEVASQEFARAGTFHDVLLRFVYLLVCQIAQAGVCNHFHTIEQRLCGWLLLVHAQAQSDFIPMTQELMAQMLGVQRAGVALIAGKLQAAGLIRYKRGRIVILDRLALESSACECYRVLKNEAAQMFPPG